jgi:ABC-type molybdate transport system substrate-binding protein
MFGKNAMRLLPTILATALTLIIADAMTQLAAAADIKVISGGAFKQVLNALAE